MGKNLHGNLVNAIEESKSRDLFILITALGIRHVGAKGAKSLANSYKNLDKVLAEIYDKNANLDDLKAKFGENLVNFVTTRIKTNKFKLIQPKIAKIRKNLRTNNA